MSYYDDLTPVPNTDGEVWIHKIKGSKKGIWYVRIKRLTVAGYFKKSLKTQNMFEAMKKANRYWIQVREAEEQNVILAPKNNFKSLMSEYFLHRRKRSKEKVVRALERQFQMYYVPYFGDWNVANITEQSYIQYLNNFRLHKDKIPSMRKKPTLRTLDVEQSNLLSFLAWCFRSGRIRHRPDMRKIISNQDWINDPSLVDYDKPQRRDMISMETYQTVREFLRYVPNLRPRDTYESDYHEVSRRRLHFYLISMYNLCCRAGEELLALQFKDFAIQPSELHPDSYYMVMTTKYGKKVAKRRHGFLRHLTYYSDYAYVGYFNTWVKFLQSKGFPTDPESYVFPVRKRTTDSPYHKGYKTYDEWDGDYLPLNSQATTAHIRRIRKNIKEWAKEKGRLTPRINAEIDMFSPYSIRHLAIRNLIVESGYSMSRVAERCNTGLKMVEDHYYKYGIKPEERIVSKHPNPSAHNTRKHESATIKDLANVVEVKPIKKSGKRYYD
tara:strand:+ start:3287 stop:4774 length:1488 start_codon:yes stop_codon:yes gene_type:complete